MTDAQRQVYEADVRRRYARNDLALDCAAVLADDGRWGAPHVLRGTDPPVQPDYEPDDGIAQSYLALMRAKGIDQPRSLAGQTLRIEEDGTVLWPGPDRVFHALTGPGGWQRNEERLRHRDEQPGDTP